MIDIKENLKQLNIILPKPNAAAANYIPYKKIGNILFISGQTCRDEFGKMLHKGQVNTVEQGQIAAKQCAINLMAQVFSACEGDWKNLKSCVRLTIFVNAHSDFIDHAKVANGASDFIVSIMGDNGKHTRSAVGSSSLPSNSSVEIDAIFEINP